MKRRAAASEWSDLLFPSPYTYTLCTTEQQFRRVCKHLAVPKDRRPSFMGGGDAWIHFFEGGRKRAAVVCINVPRGAEDLQVYAMLVHEAVHLWQAIRDEMDEKEPSSEFEAYSIQGLVQWLLYEYRRQTKR